MKKLIIFLFLVLTYNDFAFSDITNISPADGSTVTGESSFNDGTPNTDLEIDITQFDNSITIRDTSNASGNFSTFTNAFVALMI